MRPYRALGLVGALIALMSCGTDSPRADSTAPNVQEPQQSAVLLASGTGAVRIELDADKIRVLTGEALGPVSATGRKHFVVETSRGTLSTDILAGTDGRVTSIRVTLNGKAILDGRFSRNGTKFEGNHSFGALGVKATVAGDGMSVDGAAADGSSTPHVAGTAFAKSIDAQAADCAAALAAFAGANAYYLYAMDVLASAIITGVGVIPATLQLAAAAIVVYAAALTVTSSCPA